MRPADTSPEAWEVFLDAQRRMTPGERLSLVFELSDRARQLAMQAVRDRFPNADEQEVLHRYARTKLGDDLFRRAYGNVLPPDPPGAEPPFDLDRIGEEALRLHIDGLFAQSRRAEQH